MATVEGKLDYTRRDFTQLINAALEYIKHYIPQIQDTTRSNPGIRFLRLMAGVHDVLLRYIDLAFNERSLTNARQLRNQILNVEIINYKLEGPTGASGVEVFTQTDGGAGTIPQWQEVRTRVSPARTYVTTESASPPGLGLTVSLSIVQGKRFTDELLAQSSDGSAGQAYVLLRRRPIKQYIEVKVNDILWTRVNDLLDYGLTDQVYEVTYDENMFGIVIFGDNENGLAPALGDKIEADYVATDGVEGEVDANLITAISGLPGYTVNNPQGTSGASDGDTAESIAKNAPKQFNTIKRAVIDDDFSALATQISEVYSAESSFSRAYAITVRIVPVGGGAPAQALIDSVYNHIQPKMMKGTALTVDGFELAFMLVDCNVRLKSRATSKQDARAAIIEAANELLNYTEMQVGKAWAPSDFYSIVEGLEDGELVDLVDADVFSRVPRVVGNAEANLSVTEINVLEDCDYADWAMYRKSAGEFYVYKDDSFVGEGEVGVLWTSLGNEISLKLGDNAQQPRDSGTAGQCQDPGGGLDNQFYELGALFITNGVQPGDTLTIIGGPNAGSYTIATIPLETTLTIATQFPSVPSSNEVWEITYGNTINVGAVWIFSTSKAVGPVQVDSDEFPQDFQNVPQYLVINLFYPDEWEYN